MGGVGELMGLYATRSEIAPSTITSLVSGADRHIDLLAYAGTWLWDSVPHFAETLTAKIACGCQVRVCLGDC
jgi:hypothetical protein